MHGFTAHVILLYDLLILGGAALYTLHMLMYNAEGLPQAL